MVEKAWEFVPVERTLGRFIYLIGGSLISVLEIIVDPVSRTPLWGPKHPLHSETGPVFHSLIKRLYT